MKFQLKDLLYSVIYSADVPGSMTIDWYFPAGYKLQDPGPWGVTEDDEQYDYDYLEGDWAIGYHRKFCAILTYKEFVEFVGGLYLYAEDVRTEGSLGAPGFGFGWAPAISFTAEDPNAILSAYVTPIAARIEGDELVPLEGAEEPLGEEAWEQIRALALEEFGC